MLLITVTLFKLNHFEIEGIIPSRVKPKFNYRIHNYWIRQIFDFNIYVIGKFETDNHMLGHPTFITQNTFESESHVVH